MQIYNKFLKSTINIIKRREKIHFAMNEEEHQLQLFQVKLNLNCAIQDCINSGNCNFVISQERHQCYKYII